MTLSKLYLLEFQREWQRHPVNISPEFQEWSNYGQAHMFRQHMTYRILLSQSVTMDPLMFVPVQPSEQSHVVAGGT